MPDTVTFAGLPRITPTIWSHMRLCGLRGLLASAREAEAWVLHDPRLWLGRAFHKAMEAAARPGASPDDAESAWNSEVDAAARAAADHPIDFRFGSKESWPSYFLMRQRALGSAAQVQTSASAASSARWQGRRSARGAERLIETRDGKLAGRPDFFDGRTITEFKSSLPDRSWPRAQEILDAYQRQLRLYAAILADIENRWPTSARLVAASGRELAFSIDPDECKAEAEAAVGAMNDLNRQIRLTTPAENLASADSASCGRCPFQVICPAFWKWIERNGFEDSPAAASLEVLCTEDGNDGDLYTAHVRVLASTHPVADRQVLVLRRSVHGDLSGSPPGTRWRIVSAAVRGDAQLKSSRFAVVLKQEAVPVLAVDSSAADPQSSRH